MTTSILAKQPANFLVKLHNVRDEFSNRGTFLCESLIGLRLCGLDGLAIP
jgi:hypothetical protein